jgi:NhaP-type Na+/H+ or K+/H+ antiporter
VIAVLLFIFKLLFASYYGFFGKTEVFMVNSLGLPFDSGSIFVTVLLIALFYFGLQYTNKKGLQPTIP